MPITVRPAIVRSLLVTAGAVFVAALLVAPAHSAYRGHADNPDIAALLGAYPSLKNTAADSCATCHRSGRVADPLRGGAVRSENHCDYCHGVYVRDKHDARETLNAYGAAYLAAGRNEAAVRALDGKDADVDGHSNGSELKAGTDPGEPASNPSLPPAPSRAYTVAALERLAPVLDQVVFLNSTKSRSGDGYSSYRGQKLGDVLQAVGMLPSAETVDLLAADGYERSFMVGEIRQAWPQGRPALGLGRADLGSCGWVAYDVAGLDAAKPLPDAWILMASAENGRRFDTARFDPSSGRLVGRGPLRAIVPQFRPAPPDLPQFADASCPSRVAAEYHFHDAYDHNAGASVAAIVAVRIRPLPKGTRDVNWQAQAPQSLAKEEITFFGALAPTGR